MLRRIAKYLIDRATIEGDQLLTRAHLWLAETEPPPAPAPAPVAKPAPLMPTEMASRWHSSAYHVEVLGSRVCPECSEAKDEGAYFCKACIARKKAAATPRQSGEP